MSELPTPGSVWGNPSDQSRWRLIMESDETKIVASRWSGHLMTFTHQKWAALLESGFVDIRAMLAASFNHDRLIAWLKDPNRKPPVIAFTSGVERQVADLALAMRGNSMTCPMCQNGYAGRCPATGEANDCHYCDGNGNVTAESFVEMKDRCEEMVGNAMYRDIVEREEAELNEPHTVEWLVEIGGIVLREEQFETIIGFTGEVDGRWRLVYSSVTDIGWSVLGEPIPVPITTKRDVLKWLDVLGIQTRK